MTWPVVIVLVFAGLICINLRLRSQPAETVLRGDSFWRVSYHLQFTANKAKARLQFAFPYDTAHCRISHREDEFPGLVTDRHHSKTSEMRLIDLEAKRVGSYNVVPKFDIHLSPRAAWPAATSGELSAEMRGTLLHSRKGIEVEDPIVLSTLEKIQASPVGKAELVDRLFEHCVTEIAPGGRESPSDAVLTLKQGVGSPLGRARAFVALCRAGKIPARLVIGLQIKPSDDIKPHVWAEVLLGDRWEPFDPENGFTHEMPHNYVPVRRDSASIVQSDDISDLHATFSAKPIQPEDSVRGGGRHFADVLDLTRLPVEMHAVFEVILLMPLGALVTAIFRTIIGIRTFGTFTPTLIALAFVYNDWRTGIVVFSVVMVLGLGTRSLLDRLKLLLVPRLSVILTLVAMCMVFSVSVLDYYDYTPSAQAVLLPMVILTMTVERFFLTSEEDSPRFALQLLGATLLVASCCFMVLRWKTVGQKLLHYPEIHLFTVAIFVLMGRYTGYRLNELWRFSDLVAAPPEE
jgi:hypothetical protein